MSTAIRRAAKPGGSRWDVGVRSFAMSSILARHRLRTCARERRADDPMLATCGISSPRSSQLGDACFAYRKRRGRLVAIAEFSSWAFIMRTGLKLALVAAILVWTGRAEPALSEPGDFYKGKDIKLIVSATVGGGYDVYARALAKNLGEHIPGNPTIIPQNMPAAGGIAAANHMYNVAPRDGTVICLLQNTVAFEPFYANRQAQFDAAKFSWLGTPTTEVAMYIVWHASKIKTLADAQTQEMMAGGAGMASTPAFYGRVFNQLLNMKARLITGYPGQNEILLALENGEVEAMALSVLVEHQDDAPGLVSAVQDTCLVSVRLRAPSGARGRAVRARSPAQRRRQGAADRRLRAARSSFHRSAGYSR